MSQNYKDTLNLPRTDFPMKANLTAREPELLKMWEETRLYQQIQKSRKDRPLFVLHDGPPFANGDVHMGTALNKILKDLVVKSQTMLGKRAPYVPGWDCHGLPIEYKVVKESRELSPLEVRKKSEAFARKYVDLQREQFKRLGVLGDWENPYLTMDPKYEAEILRAFAVFVEKNLVYQAMKPVFWSTGAQTALAEAEVEYQERDDTAVYVKFSIVTGELAGKASIAIWTTTPWTLPANLAIAVHPKEPYEVSDFENSETGKVETFLIATKLRPAFETATKLRRINEEAALVPLPGQMKRIYAGKELEGIKAQHPFLDRQSIVLTADFVTMDTGTGAVHVAPGHGEDDYRLGRKNKLSILSPVDDHGRFTDEANLPMLTGKYVFDANIDIVNLLRERGMLLAEQKFHHSYPYCWRSKTPIIFRAVEQFFIRIDDLRGPALDAIHKEVKWIPAWGANRIAGTVESRPDWVISRQRSWGVPLPVFYDKDGKAILNPDWIRKVADLVEKHGSNIWFELTDAELAARLEINADEIWSEPIQRNTPAITSEEFETELREIVGRAREAGLTKPEVRRTFRETVRLLTRRYDTIDVWIDSGVSHKAVLQTRPELHSADILEPQDVQKAGVELPFRPADMYLEATDQHRGWFQSSLMTSIALNDRAPYKTCVTHGFVVDVDGKKISKSSSYDKPMDAAHFVGKHGADLVRLWASSINYTDDVPFSEEIFTRLGDTYRRIRNTLRILLGNLHDFDPSHDKPVNRNDYPIIDRWILSRLQKLIAVCREAYGQYHFHKVYQALNDFCSVQLSSLYIDITKDRLYCDDVDSVRRRATQATMNEVFRAVVRLLAPILAFTAEEAWSHRKLGGIRSASRLAESIHLQEFPVPNEQWVDVVLDDDMLQLLVARSKIMQAIELAVKNGVVKKPSEVRVTLFTDTNLREATNSDKSFFEEFFIVAEGFDVRITDADDVTIEKTPYQKCARCWRHRAYVGRSKAHPDLCERCESVVEAGKGA